ncbi:MAG: hypothetical protein KDJ49_08230 [Alphaproteobacteria bacterium]|nr:hypothetical protein [Alphaproteobacteria bacterium]USO08355.1 MAG: hypothetical protein H6866_03855 [Rhodospirillales bacterium]
MKKFVALMAVVATAGLLAACQPGKPIQSTAYEGHMTSAEKSSMNTSAAPMAADKSGRTFKAQ